MSTMTQTDASVPAEILPDTIRRKSGFSFMRVRVLARRELLGYFVSPVAYVAMLLFLLACGFAFIQDFKPGQPAMMRHMFEWMLWFLTFIVPVLCMGALSQEWATGTMETLMTAPVSDTDVVLGKFAGGLGFVIVLLVPTLLYVVLLMIYATPRLDLGPVFSGYLGILCVSALFVSVSLFCSSITRSQVVAAVSAFAILGAITILPWLVGNWTSLSGLSRKLVNQLVYSRYSDFSKGVIDTSNIVFFVGTSAVFLFVTNKVLEMRRWK
jgi:ABC-2 type transport system permease protein